MKEQTIVHAILRGWFLKYLKFEMQQINYIKHLNAIFVQFSKDNRLNPTHISIYIALFQIWNINRFVSEFYVNRKEVMELSKIGSKSTYHKCIKELSHWKYIIYFPSHNPYKGSRIKMFDFGTTTGQALVHSSTKSGTSIGQALVPIYKHNKTYINNKQENLKNFDKNQNREASNQEASVPYSDNLSISKNKNYDEPL